MKEQLNFREQYFLKIKIGIFGNPNWRNSINRKYRLSGKDIFSIMPDERDFTDIFSNFQPLFHCHGLRKLHLSDNEVQTLPPAIASLINLEYLDISKNGKFL